MGHRLHSDGLSQPASGAAGKLSARAERDAAPYAAKTKGYWRTMSASSVGLELAVAVLLGMFFGRWLDGRLGTTPWMMILWLVIGFTAGMRAVIRYANKDAAEADAADGESKA
jgi:F0F1-type ATP synthase assembly protein I